MNDSYSDKLGQIPAVITFKSTLDNTFNFVQMFSLYSPLIIVICVFLVALFSSSPVKGIVYVVFSIIVTALRHSAMNSSNLPAIVKPLEGGGSKKRKPMKGGDGEGSRCNMGINAYGDNATLGMFMLAFTMFYICTPMFIINSINFYVIIFFIFYIVTDFFVKSKNGCLKDGVMPIFSNIVFGVALGAIISTMIYSYQNDWSYINLVSSDKQVCNMPSKQSFKCAVYKNGEMLASTRGM
jgi:hypothetical protein